MAAKVIETTLEKVTRPARKNTVRKYMNDGVRGQIEFMNSAWDEAMQVATTGTKADIVEYGRGLVELIEAGGAHANVRAAMVEELRSAYTLRFGNTTAAPQGPRVDPVKVAREFARQGADGRSIVGAAAAAAHFNKVREMEERAAAAAAPTQTEQMALRAAPQAQREIPHGTFTVEHPDGTYETVQIETVREGGLTGKVICSYLSGPDNDTDFQGFGFVDTDGRVRLWGRHRGINPRWIGAVELVTRGSADVAGMAEAYALRSGRCARCHRKLTVPASIHRGLGPDCAEKGFAA